MHESNLCCIVLRCVKLCCTALHCIALCGIELICIVLRYVILPCAVSGCVALCCIALCCVDQNEYLFYALHSSFCKYAIRNAFRFLPIIHINLQ